MLANILFFCLLASLLPVMVGIATQFWIGFRYETVEIQVHAKLSTHNINSRHGKLRRKGKGQRSGMNEAEVQAPHSETERVGFCTVARMLMWPPGIRSSSPAPYSDDAV